MSSSLRLLRVSAYFEMPVFIGTLPRTNPSLQIVHSLLCHPQFLCPNNIEAVVTEAAIRTANSVFLVKTAQSLYHVRPLDAVLGFDLFEKDECFPIVANSKDMDAGSSRAADEHVTA